MLGAPEAFRRAFLDVTNVVVGEVLGDTRISDCMIDIARIGNSSRNRDTKVDFGYAHIVPFVEPATHILFGFFILVCIPQ